MDKQQFVHDSFSLYELLYLIETDEIETFTQECELLELAKQQTKEEN